jgi:hypothetical protein
VGSPWSVLTVSRERYHEAQKSSTISVAHRLARGLKAAARA